MCVFTRKHRPSLTAVFHHHPRKFAHLPLRHPHISSGLCAFIRETEGGGAKLDHPSLCPSPSAAQFPDGKTQAITDLSL